MPDTLITDPHLEDPDDFYAAWVELHAGLDRDASALTNARLVLLLANHIGRGSILREALAAARLSDRSPALKG